MMSNETRLPSAMHQLHSCYGTWTNSTPTLRRSLRWRAAYAISYHAQLRADWLVKMFAAVSSRQALRRTHCQQPNASGCAVRGSCLRIRNTYMAIANSRQSPMLFPPLPSIPAIVKLMHGSASAARRRLAASLEQLGIQAQRELPHELQQPLARADTSASVSDSSPKSVTVSRYGAAALQPGSRHAVAASCDAAAANVGAPWLALRAAVSARGCTGAGAEKPGSDSM